MRNCADDDGCGDLLTEPRTDSGPKSSESVHLRSRAQLLAAAGITGSAVNGVSQLVPGDKLRAGESGVGLFRAQHPHLNDATLWLLLLLLLQ